MGPLKLSLHVSVKFENVNINNLLHRVVGLYTPQQSLSTSRVLRDFCKMYKSTVDFALENVVELSAYIYRA